MLGWIGSMRGMGWPLWVVLLTAAPVAAETDTPVTLERQEGAETSEPLSVVGYAGDEFVHFIETQLRRRVEVRVRAVSGLPLTAVEREEVRTLAFTCENGHTENRAESVLPDNTVLLSFDCVRLAD